MISLRSSRESNHLALALAYIVGIAVLQVCVAQVPAPPGLAAWWKGERNALDVIGGLHGQLQGGTSFSPGMVGEGFLFDGTTSAVRIFDEGRLEFAEVTVEAWVNPLSGMDDPFGQEVIYGRAFGSPQLTVLQAPDGVRVRFQVAQGADTFPGVTSEVSIPLGTFSHVAGTFDGTVIRVFINGVLQGDAVVPPGITSACHVSIGGWGDVCGFSGGFFHGVVDELSVYTRALRTEELAGICSAGSLGKSPPTSLAQSFQPVGWWRAEQNAVDEVHENDGLQSEGLGYETGLVGHAFSFDGLMGHVEIPASEGLAVQSLTIEAWINPTSARFGGNPIVEFVSADGTAGVHLWYSNPETVISYAQGNLFANIRGIDGVSHLVRSAPDLIGFDVWSHVAVTYDQASGLARLYVNGNEVVDQQIGTFVPWTTGALSIGQRSPDNPDGLAGYRFHGLIDELALYDKALDADAIQSIYDARGAGKARSIVQWSGPVPLQNATATLSQPHDGDWSVARAIDGEVGDMYGWSISPYWSAPAVSPQTAVFETAGEVGFPEGTVLTFTLSQTHVNPYHNLGRFRLSATTDPRSTFADGLPTGGDVYANWIPLDPVSFISANGTVLSELEDHSILAGGPNPRTDVYTVSVITTLSGITGIRLEALEDPSLPQNGPGRRSENGNFVLNEFEVSAEPFDSESWPRVHTSAEIRFLTAVGTHYQVQFTSDVHQVYWTDLGEPIEGTGNEVSVFDSTRGRQKRFYRIVELD